MKAESGKDDARDQIIAVTVLGTAWVVGLCVYLYFTHRTVEVKKGNDPMATPERAIPTVPVPVEESTLPVSTLPVTNNADGDDDSVELSSLHSSELSGSNESRQWEIWDEASVLDSGESVIFDDDSM